MSTSRAYFFTTCLCTVLVQACHSSSTNNHPSVGSELLVKDAITAAIDLNIHQQDAWNRLDADGEAGANHYPYIRISDGALVVIERYETYRDIIEDISLPALLASNWDHTEWDELRAFQSSVDKVHLVGRFSRIDKSGEAYLSAATVRVVTKEKGEWGIRIRSTYPLATPDEIDNASQTDNNVAISDAIGILHRYLHAWNNRNSAELSALYHYPNVLVDGTSLFIFNAPEEYIDYQENSAFHALDYAAWDHSRMNSIEVIESGSTAVHFAVEIDDIDISENRLGTGDKGLWIVSRVGDTWGISARSMY